MPILIPFLPHFRFNATEVVQNVMHYAAREQTVPASSPKQLPVRESSPGIDRINTCACVGASECMCTTFLFADGAEYPQQLSPTSDASVTRIGTPLWSTHVPTDYIQLSCFLSSKRIRLCLIIAFVLLKCVYLCALAQPSPASTLVRATSSVCFC